MAMDLREQLLKHRKDDRFLAGGLLLLLLVFSLFYYLLQRGKGLPAVMATDKLLLFVLWYINIILILAIVFVLVRNFFRAACRCGFTVPIDSSISSAIS